ncbi:DNA circularization N-terminal domain-containing protein [Microcoleus sp. herbarium14]|uniref:DNA circularization N-terminal domain-containing protein n=1 Tax=Microcoleus sp. herbarium14 TaxID=3055439 RepID=UPI002FD0CA3F
MAIKLGKIELNKVHRIVTLEQADWVTHRIPGKLGNLVQDLGRDSVQLEISGIFYGQKAGDDLDFLRKIHKQRKAVDFVAEIVGQAYFSQVVLEKIEVWQVARSPDEFSYRLIVAEYIEPPKPSASPGVSNVDKKIKLESATLMNVASLTDVLQMGNLPEITNPIEPLKTALEPVKAATKDFGNATAGLKALFKI